MFVRNLFFGGAGARAACVAAVAGGAVAAGTTASAATVPGGLDIYRPTNPIRAELRPAPPQTSNLGTFDIVINPGAGLADNAAALDAFNRAAARWESRIADPVTINIAANLGTFSEPGVVGAASNVTLFGDYDEIRNQMVADAIARPTSTANANVVFLPTNAQFNATLPAGRSLTPGTVAGQRTLSASKANLKALGFTGLDDIPSGPAPGAPPIGPNDATITFNQAFAFDFDSRDGVTPGTIDFETTAAHEIGHALGFVSFVDDINGSPTTGGGATSVAPTTLDLFRFGRTSNNPSTPAEFTAFPRDLRPGADTITDDITSEYRMSSGLNTPEFPAITGTDGRQASHWKDNNLTGVLIGTLDPTIGTGEVFQLTNADFEAMDVIGYDVFIPEPSAAALLGFGALGLLRRPPRKA